MDVEHKPVPKNQRGEWKSGCEVVLLLWSTTNTFSSSSPEVKHFIRPAMKDSVSLSGPSFTVPCPGSTPIPDRHSAAAWSLLLLRWSQIPLGFLFFGSFEPKPSFVRTLQTCGSFSLWTVDSVISTPISPMSAALCCSFLVPCGCAGGGPFLGMVIPLQILLFESGFVPMWR